MTGRRKYQDVKRVCYSCGSERSYFDIIRKYEHWYNNHPIKEMWLCENCNNKYIKNPINNPRRIVFIKSQIHIKNIPRIGVCNLCRNVVGFDCKRTLIHHESYHNDDPLKDTLECCNRCHRRRHMNII